LFNRVRSITRLFARITVRRDRVSFGAKYARTDNGQYKYVSARNLKPSDIHQHVQQYRNTSGIAPFKPKFPVLSETESIRGIWTPFKDPKLRPACKPQSPRFLYANNF
jgi:hypothetical protein